MKYSIVIPLFNEEKNINSLIEEIILNLNNVSFKYEIILVDDHSNDKTFEQIISLKNKFTNKIVLKKNIKNFGQSYSIREGIKIAKSQNIITIDGDGQNNPSDIISLIQIYETKNFSLVGGIRAKRMDKFIKIISSKIANKIRSFIFRDNCPDTGCSLKIFDKKMFLSFPYFDGIHRFLPALFTGYGKKTIYIKVDHRPRLYGNSKYGTFLRAIRGVRDMFKVYLILRAKND